jgi:prepilin-type N-terminal cleavage/methylation domain-containing protein
VKLKKLIRGENGFTLIEMVVVVAITGIIALGGATATYHVMINGGRNADATAASQNALNAIHWISRDAQMAQTVSPGGASGFPLTLRWVAWDNIEHEVVYTLDDGELTRAYSTDGSSESEAVVAQCINPDAALTNCGFFGGVLSLKVTATVGEGARAVSVGKVREIAPRPRL